MQEAYGMKEQNSFVNNSLDQENIVQSCLEDIREAKKLFAHYLTEHRSKKKNNMNFHLAS